jgi:hypothetical protein
VGLGQRPNERDAVTALRVAVVSSAVFIATLALMSKTGVASMPCGATLEVYCWTRDLLGAGMAFLLWNGLFSLALGWALVVLPAARRE